MQNAFWHTLARVRRGKQLLRTTQFIVLSNFLRTGLLDFLRTRRELSASLDEIVDFHFVTSLPPHPEDIELLVAYTRAEANPSKGGFVDFLLAKASWLGAKRSGAKFTAPDSVSSDWRGALNALHASDDPSFAGRDPEKRKASREHWRNFLVMADAFGIVQYENQTARLSPRAATKLERELEIFGDGYYGVDDLLGVLLKVEGLRAETDFIVTPPPFMLESCDALARRLGIDAYFRHSPRLARGGCRVLDLACGSGIYSNAFAEKGSRCIAIDGTPWVFYRAFLAAHENVRVELGDMNALPEHVTREPFTHVICNLAAHHFHERRALFRAWRERLEPRGEICMLNFDYSLDGRRNGGTVARLKRQFAAQIRYNWTLLDYARGNVQFISPGDVARELEAEGFETAVHACDRLGELFLVRGVKK